MIYPYSGDTHQVSLVDIEVMLKGNVRYIRTCRAKV
jgi:hypothetical protein